ncbi:MAG: DUF1295 domain-containing protein, partial [Actinomycetota bacterium]|nr:DUF1295 domain-containing protein [Actinomycetota bacterium]
MIVTLAALVAEPSTRDFALANLGVQAVMFGLGACLPAYRTGVVAFTDLVWPWGLAAIGVLALVFGDPGSALLLVVVGMYVLMGARGGAIGVRLTLTTDVLREDMPRYHYRRLTWRREGYRSDTAPMLHDILQQCLANSSALAVPAMLAVADSQGTVGPVVIAGALLWAVSWVLESVADAQKARFARRCAEEGVTRTCDVGFWRYSRHPNYFFEWLAWHGLILVALPSLIRLADDFAVLPWLGFAAALAGISGGLYYSLVYYTGAIPAEHFSVQHRPDYRDYQQRVNRFFPGPRRRR